MTKRQAVELGATGLVVPTQGLRDESFEYLRSGRAPVASMPITVMVYPNGLRVITDGRHRITIAREQGKAFVRGRMIGLGPRGGVQWSYTGKVLI
jgi:hypothetical protein